VEVDAGADRGVVLVDRGGGKCDIPGIVRDRDAVDPSDEIAFDRARIDSRSGDAGGFVEHAVLVRIPIAQPEQRAVETEVGREQHEPAITAESRHRQRCAVAVQALAGGSDCDERRHSSVEIADVQIADAVGVGWIEIRRH
jgi:hypothetical protein